jgi:hypothetical protein
MGGRNASYAMKLPCEPQDVIIDLNATRHLHDDDR